MGISTLVIEVFGHIVTNFTRGVTEHYNPEEPEFIEESFGYNSLESAGRAWYCHPVDELIYQEYSDREATSLNYLASSSLDVKVIDACSTEENEQTQEDQRDEDRAMAWKRLRPSALHTVCKSMYIGALISLLTSLFIGTIYMMVTYVSFKTVHNCQFYPMNSISVQMQWIRSMSDVVSCGFLYIWFFVLLQLFFRPFQLMGIKRKLLLVCFITYSLDTLYRIILQALSISHSNISYPEKIPLNACLLANQCLQIYILTSYFCTILRQKLTFLRSMV